MKKRNFFAPHLTIFAWSLREILLESERKFFVTITDGFLIRAKLESSWGKAANGCLTVVKMDEN